MSVIELKNITKEYGKVKAVRGVDLTVDAGEIIGFLGPNGAGKTTLIQIMLGLRTASGGTVRIFDGAPRARSVRTRVGAMLQESGVPFSLKVGEIVELFQSYYPYTLPTETILRRAGLDSKRGSLINDLSGGQKQRLYFALAIAGDPDLLFLDEPTVGMDVGARRDFWDQVKEFAALGKTILFSTHYLEEADVLASRIVVIQNGRVLTQGRPREIKRMVADTEVRLQSDADIEQVRLHPVVRGVYEEAGQMVIHTTEPEALLRWFFEQGHDVAELMVQRADLEDAFLTMMREQTDDRGD